MQASRRVTTAPHISFSEPVGWVRRLAHCAAATRGGARRWVMFKAVPTAIAVAGLLVVASLAEAHDSWISRGAYRNPAGEWCVRDNDCESPSQVGSSGRGWFINCSGV